jgi:hypothetical protein
MHISRKRSIAMLLVATTLLITTPTTASAHFSRKRVVLAGLALGAAYGVFRIWKYIDYVVNEAFYQALEKTYKGFNPQEKFLKAPPSVD